MGTPEDGAVGSVLGQGTGSCLPQLDILHVATKASAVK